VGLGIFIVKNMHEQNKIGQQILSKDFLKPFLVAFVRIVELFKASSESSFGISLFDNFHSKQNHRANKEANANSKRHAPIQKLDKSGRYQNKNGQDNHFLPFKKSIDSFNSNINVIHRGDSFGLLGFASVEALVRLFSLSLFQSEITKSRQGVVYA